LIKTLELERFSKWAEDKIISLDFISDPAHGWIKIPKNLVFGLEFSQFSYQDKKYYYLEEDCDASKYLDLIHGAGVKTEFNEITYNEDCFIRELEILQN
jgi:hypothetical protein